MTDPEIPTTTGAAPCGRPQVPDYEPDVTPCAMETSELRHVAGAVNDAHDLDASAGNSVEDQIASLDKATRFWRDIGPGWAQAGKPRERRAAPFQTIEESVGRCRVVARDVEPDVQQIGFGLPRRANARQSFKPLRACA